MELLFPLIYDSTLGQALSGSDLAQGVIVGIRRALWSLGNQLLIHPPDTRASWVIQYIQTSLVKNRNVPHHHSSSAPVTRPPRQSLKPSEQREPDRVASPPVGALVLDPLVVARWHPDPVPGVNHSNTTLRELPGNISPRGTLALAYLVLSGRLRQPGIVRRIQILESDLPGCGPWFCHLNTFPRQ